MRNDAVKVQESIKIFDSRDPTSLIGADSLWKEIEEQKDKKPNWSDTGEGFECQANHYTTKKKVLKPNIFYILFPLDSYY